MVTAGCPSEEAADGECVSTQKYFEDQVWSAFMQDNCFACHNPQGQARDTKFVLMPLGVPGALETNLATSQHVANFEYEGKSILLLKPSAQMAHAGGERFAVGSREYQALESLIQRFREPVECEDAADTSYLSGVMLLDDQQTLRKAALTLAGRLPTPAELQGVAENGEEGLETALMGLMTEDAFFDRLEQIFNDKLLTNRYLGGNNATNLINADEFPNRRWYEEDSEYAASAEYKELGSQYTNNSVATAPMQLIKHIVANDRPFTEVVTADYMMVNPFSAIVYGVEDAIAFNDPNDPTEWHEVKVPDIPHAGLLTEKMWLSRFPTTATNRNRHRARMTMQFFMATDILRLAERPIDPTAIVDHNPTMFNPECTVCHEVMDPISGAFQNWNNGTTWSPREEGWHSDMLAPGYGDVSMPGAQTSTSLKWLAGRIAEDDRFALSLTYWLYEGIIGQAPLYAPSDTAHPDYESKKRAYDNQDLVLNEVADAFAADNMNLKRAIIELVKSPYFRAAGTSIPVDEEARIVDLDPVGMGRLLPPEDLNRKISATTGYAWERSYDGRDYLTGDYRLFYGGIDSDDVTKRITQPNGVMANVAWRMANEVSCQNGPRDFTKNRTDRVLFPLVETTFVPEDENGFTVPGAKQAIKENIQHLHAHLLSEELELNDPEIERTYQLWYETWKEGQAAVQQDTIDDYLPYRCRAERDYYTGDDLPEDAQVRRDQHYTIRSWMAVLTYLLADYKFLHE